MKLDIILSICMLFMLPGEVLGQDPLRFQSEVEKLMEKHRNFDPEDLIVFTGSSSVRFWLNLEEEFPDFNIVNNGFGGSQMSDLIYYQDSLITKYKPTKVFIYEGDNDIQFGKTPNYILGEAQTVAEKIQEHFPRTRIYFITAKPSIARWTLKEKYIEFNRLLAEWAESKSSIEIIDVWSPMCDQDGSVLNDIFIEDDLHMNAKGYEIWRKTLKPYIQPE